MNQILLKHVGIENVPQALVDLDVCLRSVVLLESLVITNPVPAAEKHHIKRRTHLWA